MSAKKDIKINVANDNEADNQDLREVETDSPELETTEDTTTDSAEAPGAEPGDSSVAAGEATTAEDPQKRIAELEDRLLRAQAEFENYKKRTARQYEDMVLAANSQLLLELLATVDSFERAFEHTDRDVSIESLTAGMEMIHNQLTGLLAKHRVTPIEAVGKPFDPALHEAIMQVDSTDYDEGVVALEVTRGYRLGDKVLRFAQVAVSKGAPSSDQDENRSQVQDD